MLKPNISCSESRGLDAQTHPCLEEFVHGLRRRASAHGGHPRRGPNRTLLTPLGIEGQILTSVTPILIQHNSPESAESSVIHHKVTANGTRASCWELGSGTGDARAAPNRCEGVKSPRLPPCVCALGRRADSITRHLPAKPRKGRAFPSQAEWEALFWRVFKWGKRDPARQQPRQHVMHTVPRHYAARSRRCSQVILNEQSLQGVRAHLCPGAQRVAK